MTKTYETKSIPREVLVYTTCDICKRVAPEGEWDKVPGMPPPPQEGSVRDISVRIEMTDYSGYPEYSATITKLDPNHDKHLQ